MTSLPSAFLVSALALWQASPAPTKPDFSGYWSIDRGQSESPTQTELADSVNLSIKHTSDEVVIETTRGGKSATRRFPIDLMGRRDGNASPSVVPRAYWDGAKLVTEGAVTIQGQTVSTRETLSLNPGGNELIVERLIVVQHGYSFRGAQNYGTAKDVYKRGRPPSSSD